MEEMAWRSLRLASQRALRRIDVRVEGLAHVPDTGPAILAARHFHHLWDGCALLATIPRPLHLVVALDWLHNPIGKPMLERACRLAGWPMVVRPDAPREGGTDAEGAGRTGALLTATRASVAVLRRGGAVLIFPEGYPNVDPGYTPKQDDDDFLPFQPGFARFALLAQQGDRPEVPIVPVGLEYRRGDRWSLTVRFGPPHHLRRGEDLARQVREIEEQVRFLSGFA